MSRERWRQLVPCVSLRSLLLLNTPMRTLYVLLLSRVFSTKSRARREAIPVRLRRFTIRPLKERVTSSSSETNPYIVPTYLDCIAVPVGYADNSNNVPCSSSLDAEYRTGWRPIENHERGSVSLLFTGFTLRLEQDPVFERMTHVFRETRSA